MHLLVCIMYVFIILAVVLRIILAAVMPCTRKTRDRNYEDFIEVIFS
jgi:type IV secretory pathway component VirB8